MRSESNFNYGIAQDGVNFYCTYFCKSLNRPVVLYYNLIGQTCDSGTKFSLEYRWDLTWRRVPFCPEHWGIFVSQSFVPAYSTGDRWRPFELCASSWLYRHLTDNHCPHCHVTNHLRRAHDFRYTCLVHLYIKQIIQTILYFWETIFISIIDLLNATEISLNIKCSFALVVQRRVYSRRGKRFSCTCFWREQSIE